MSHASTRLFVASGLACLVASGCPEETVPRPTIYVQRHVLLSDGTRCAVQCSTGTLPALVEPACTMGETCVLAPGRDELRIIVDYGEVVFDANQTLPSASVSVLWDSTPSGPPDVVAATKADDGTAQAVKEVIVPLAQSGELTISASVGAGFSGSAGPFSIVAPDIAVTFERCDASPGSACELPAGGGRTIVRVDAPRGLANVVLTSYLDEVQQGQGITVPIAGPVGEDLFPLVDVPDQEGARWKIVARADLSPTSTLSSKMPAIADLVAAPDVELGAIAPDAAMSSFVDGEFPQRIALEPDPECRRATAVVRIDGAGPEHRVELTTSAGVLDDQGKTVERTFDDSGTVTIELVLDDELVPGGRVVLTAASEEFGKVERIWEMAPLLAVDAELFLPGSPQFVDAEGTPGLTVTGILVPPRDLTLNAEFNFAAPQFSPGTVATVLLAPAAEGMAPCGTPVPAKNIKCDRRGLPNTTRGGCVWTPDVVTVAADGSFALELPAGSCFVGALDISVYGMTYPANTFDPTRCVGEQRPSENTVPMPLSLRETIVYLPEPSEDTTSTEGTGTSTTG